MDRSAVNRALFNAMMCRRRGDLAGLEDWARQLVMEIGAGQVLALARDRAAAAARAEDVTP